MSQHVIDSLEKLEALYPKEPVPATRLLEIDHINVAFRTLVEISPFALLSTSGPAGLEVSPRGGAPGFIKIIDEKTLLIPQAAGNNRLDSMRNLLSDPRVGLMSVAPHQ